MTTCMRNTHQLCWPLLLLWRLNKGQDALLITQLPLPTDFSLEAYNRWALSRMATSTWQIDYCWLVKWKITKTQKKKWQWEHIKTIKKWDHIYVIMSLLTNMARCNSCSKWIFLFWKITIQLYNYAPRLLA